MSDQNPHGTRQSDIVLAITAFLFVIVMTFLIYTDQTIPTIPNTFPTALFK